MRRDAHNVRKTLTKVQTASRMYVLDMCGYKRRVLQPQFNYRQPLQARSAHSNMGGSEALTRKGGLGPSALLTILSWFHQLCSLSYRRSISSANYPILGPSALLTILSWVHQLCSLCYPRSISSANYPILGPSALLTILSWFHQLC